MSSEAYRKFIESMRVGHEQWHDGIGYDLEALSELDPVETEAAMAVLVSDLASGDWRPVEALAALGTASAMAALEQALEEMPPAATPGRLRLADVLARAGVEVAVDQMIVDVLRASATMDECLSLAIDLAPEYPTDLMRRAVVELAVDGSDAVRVAAAGLVLYFAGRAEEPFDWEQRPFLLRFASDDPAERRAALAEIEPRLG